MKHKKHTKERDAEGVNGGGGDDLLSPSSSAQPDDASILECLASSDEVGNPSSKKKKSKKKREREEGEEGSGSEFSFATPTNFPRPAKKRLRMDIDLDSSTVDAGLVNHFTPTVTSSRRSLLRMKAESAEKQKNSIPVVKASDEDMEVWLVRKPVSVTLDELYGSKLKKLKFPVQDTLEERVTWSLKCGSARKLSCSCTMYGSGENKAIFHVRRSEEKTFVIESKISGLLSLTAPSEGMSLSSDNCKSELPSAGESAQASQSSSATGRTSIPDLNADTTFSNSQLPSPFSGLNDIRRYPTAPPQWVALKQRFVPFGIGISSLNKISPSKKKDKKLSVIVKSEPSEDQTETEVERKKKKKKKRKIKDEIFSD